jgi:CRP-like cAMP-binding protein
MAEHPPRSQDFSQQRFDLTVAEDLLLGGRKLHQAFLATRMCFAGRDTPLIRADQREPAVVLLRKGFAYRACVLSGGGRRAILDVLLAGDIAGLDNIVLARATEHVVAADRAEYWVLPAAALRDLMADRCVALYVVSLLAAARWRSDRLVANIGRLDAFARIAVLLLGIHDRLKRQGVINRPTFDLLSQERIADHLGLTLQHVNRTLRKLREEKIVLIDRQVVIIEGTSNGCADTPTC